VTGAETLGTCGPRIASGGRTAGVRREAEARGAGRGRQRGAEAWMSNKIVIYEVSETLIITNSIVLFLFSCLDLCF
jgi:hypothetical protein